MTSQRQVSSEEGEALANEVGAIWWTEVSSLTGANGKQPSSLMMTTKLCVHGADHLMVF
jgi:hypothetical protein